MLYQQARLHDRGAAEMVLQMISASKGGKTHIDLSAFLQLPPHLLHLYNTWLVVIRSTWCYSDFHPQTGHLHPQWGKHTGPAGTYQSACRICLINTIRPLLVFTVFLSRCRKCWTTWRRKETLAFSKVCLDWWCLAGDAASQHNLSHTKQQIFFLFYFSTAI